MWQAFVNYYIKTPCLPKKGSCKFTTLGDPTYNGACLSPLFSQTAGRLFPSFLKDEFNNCQSFSFLHNIVSCLFLPILISCIWYRFVKSIFPYFAVFYISNSLSLQVPYFCCTFTFTCLLTNLSFHTSCWTAPSHRYFRRWWQQVPFHSAKNSGALSQALPTHLPLTSPPLFFTQCTSPVSRLPEVCKMLRGWC